MRPALNTLFLSAGRRVELLRAFRRAYSSLGLAGRTVAVDVDPLAPALQVADRATLVPRREDPGLMDRLLAVCADEHVSVVFPLTDPDVEILALHRERFERAGVRVAAVPTEAAAAVLDKLHTFEFFRRIGVRTPETWTPSDRMPAGTTFPLFVKPRRGSASVGAFPVRTARELEMFTEYVDDPVIQEFLPGPEITSDVVCGLDGELLTVVCRRRIEVRWGEVAKGVTVHHPDIVEACARIAAALPAVGPITVQCLLKDGIPYFTEINARFGGGLPLSIAAGIDVPELLLASLAGLPYDRPALGEYRSDVFLTRFDESFILDRRDSGMLKRVSESG